MVDVLFYTQCGGCLVWWMSGVVDVWCDGCLVWSISYFTHSVVDVWCGGCLCGGCRTIVNTDFCYVTLVSHDNNDGDDEIMKKG